LLKNISLDKISEFEREFLDVMETQHKDTLDFLASGKIDDAACKVIEQCAEEVAKKF